MKTAQRHLTMMKKLVNGPIKLMQLTHGVENSQNTLHYARYLEEAQALGLVVCIGEDWSLTNSGRERLAADTKKNIATGKLGDWKERPIYDGHDLRDLTNRVGAYDAYKLPSLIGGQLVYPRGQNV